MFEGILWHFLDSMSLFLFRNHRQKRRKPGKGGYQSGTKQNVSKQNHLKEGWRLEGKRSRRLGRSEGREVCPARGGSEGPGGMKGSGE
jgi:hypothetical protein